MRQDTSNYAQYAEKPFSAKSLQGWNPVGTGFGRFTKISSGKAALLRNTPVLTDDLLL